MKDHKNPGVEIPIDMSSLQTKEDQDDLEGLVDPARISRACTIITMTFIRKEISKPEAMAAMYIIMDDLKQEGWHLGGVKNGVPIEE